MRSLLYICTLALAGVFVNAAPVPYNPAAPALSQDIDNLFQYISSKNSGADMSEKQQIEQDIATLQAGTDTNSQEYRTALDTFWSDLGGLWVKYPEWSGWSGLQSDISKVAWANTEHDQHKNDVSTASHTTLNSFDSDLNDLEEFVKENDIASISDVYIIKQAILWLKNHEHTIETSHDFVEQATQADDAWGRLQKNNPGWSHWTQAEQDFKDNWSQTLQDVSNSTLPNMYANETSHNNGVQYEELSSFFDAPSHPDAGVQYEDLESFFNAPSHSNAVESTPADTDLDTFLDDYFSENGTSHTNDGVDMDAYIDDVFAKLSAPTETNHLDGLSDVVQSWNEHDSY